MIEFTHIINKIENIKIITEYQIQRNIKNGKIVKTLNIEGTFRRNQKRLNNNVDCNVQKPVTEIKCIPTTLEYRN